MRLITIGKSESNNIILRDNAVSRIHLEIFIDDDDKIFVTDKESINGTFVNGNRIVGSKLISKHDIIKAANTIVNWKRYILDDKRTEFNNIVSSNQIDDQYSHKHPENKVKVKTEKSELYSHVSDSGWQGILSLSCAVLGWFIFGLPLGICAVVFGAMGLNKKLKGLAIAGVVVGIFEIIIMLRYLSLI